VTAAAAVVWVGVEGRGIVGAVGVADTLRPDAVQTVQRLQVCVNFLLSHKCIPLPDLWVRAKDADLAKSGVQARDGLESAPGVI
jgi:hypothetical protein